MTGKFATKQTVRRRVPQQDRARQKIALILEAATRLIEHGDIVSLTTNAIAAKAGISIGTLYQYFADKDAILRALVDHEMAGIAARVHGYRRSSMQLRQPAAVSGCRGSCERC